MLAHAKLAVAAASGKTREDLDSDPVLAAALERFIEVIGEAANKISPSTTDEASEMPWHEIVGNAQPLGVWRRVRRPRHCLGRGDR